MSSSYPWEKCGLVLPERAGREQEEEGTLSIRELKEGLQWGRWGQKGDAAGEAGWGRTTWGQIQPARDLPLIRTAGGAFQECQAGVGRVRFAVQKYGSSGKYANEVEGDTASCKTARRACVIRDEDMVAGFQGLAVGLLRSGQTKK